MVGTNTAVADNPKLNTRLWQGNSPVRVVLDRNHRIPEDSHLFDGLVKTVVITNKASEEKGSKNVIFETINFEEDLPQQICNILYQHKIQSVIIEGGQQTLQTFIDAGKWDEARIFTGKSHFREGIEAPRISGEIVSEDEIDGDQLKIYLND
jgi:diaminohydroxyphosphoribosylaminopyrimidine deaminase/5-amino-6-(5-phosphoribosylamino)uracil reductase